MKKSSKKYDIKCDDCKCVIGETDDMTASLAGGLCDECKRKKDTRTSGDDLLNSELTKSLKGLELTIKSLQEALKICSSVEGIIILDLIRKSREFEIATNGLLYAHKNDNA